MQDKKRTLQDFLSDEPESKKEMKSEASIPSLLFKARNDANINLTNYLQINLYDNIVCIQMVD